MLDNLSSLSIPEIIISIVSVILTSVVVPWLNSWRKSHEAQAEAARQVAVMSAEQGRLTHNQARNYLIDTRLIRYLQRIAVNLITQDLPLYVKVIQEEGKDKWGLLKAKLIEDLRSKVIQKFLEEGTDIVKELGADTLLELVTSTIIDMLPIPNGWEDEAEFLKDKVAPLLVKYGSAWVMDRLSDNRALVEIIDHVEEDETTRG